MLYLIKNERIQWITRPFYYLVFYLLLAHNVEGQVLLQLEEYDDPISKKFGVGDVLIYRTVQSGKKWSKQKITTIDYKNQQIIFTRGMHNLSDITHIKIEKPGTTALGTRLIDFSILWFIYRGAASLINQEWELGWDRTGIGVGAFLTGYSLKKVAGTQVFNVEKKHRLRIIDIGWPEPEKE